MKALSTLGFLLTVAAVVGLQLRHALFATSPVGVAFQVAGVALVLWARLTFRARSLHFAADPTEGPLVRSGPYRFVRNPIYAGALLAVGAGVVVHPGLVNAALGLVAFGGTMVRILCEEHLLAKKYPEYAGYCRATGRLLPFRALAGIVAGG